MRIVIVGGMKKAEFLIQSLIKKRHTIKVIHDDENYCKWLARNYDVDIIYGDASKQFILDEAEIADYDLLIAMTPKDEDNLVICQLAKKKFNVHKTFSTVSNPKNVEIFKTLGVDNVVSSTYIVAGIIEEMALKNVLTGYVKIESSGIGILEIIIQPNFVCVNQSLHKLSLPEKTLIAYIIRENHYIVPTGKTMLYAKDKIIVICPNTVKDSVVDALSGGVKDAKKRLNS